MTYRRAAVTGATGQARGAALLACGLLLIASSCSGDEQPDAAASETAATAQPATSTTAPPSATPAAEGSGGPTALAFVHTGAAGDDGCRYTGPDEVSTAIVSTVTNRSDRKVLVSMARLADGATQDDFLAAMAELGDSFPVMVPPRLHDPAAHDWMEGQWLELHVVGGGESQTVEREALFEGEYVAFCFRPSPDGAGSELWPAGSLTVRGAD